MLSLYRKIVPEPGLLHNRLNFKPLHPAPVRLRFILSVDLFYTLRNLCIKNPDEDRQGF